MKHNKLNGTTGLIKLADINDHEAVLRRPNGQTITFLINPSQRLHVEAILRKYF